jgi:hypothetical protein
MNACKFRPPGEYGDAQGWRAPGVMKKAGERIFEKHLTKIHGRARPLRRFRHWMGVPA